MAYSIQAIIAARGTFPIELPNDVVVLQLNSGLQMVPLGNVMRRKYGISFLPLTDEGRVELPAALVDLCIKLGARGPIAYIEAELFGGSGAQAHVLIPKPGVVTSVVVSNDAINESLRWLGVQRRDGQDEFEAVGLGKHRETDDWLRNSKS